MRQIKYIKQDVQFTVWGYIRQTENELSLFCVIPPIISHLCLSYYHQPEYFEKTGKEIEISNDKMTVIKKVKGAPFKEFKNTTYGATWINSTVHQIVEWKFKINVLTRSMYICLVSCDNRENDDCNERYYYEDFPNFGICSSGTMYLNYDRSSGGFKSETDSQCHFGKKDVISMILNTKCRELSLRKREQIFLVAKEVTVDSKIKYKMAISLRDLSDSISLIDFKQNFI